MDAEVIVVGTGGMGSAVADALSGRGLRVLGLDRFGPGHDRGSSHGRTRIVRSAYFESPSYIPLLRRAYALWDRFPADCTLRRVGCLMLGRSASPVVTGAAHSAAEEGIPVEVLTSSETARRFPAFAPGADEVAIFEPGAGYVCPEATVRFLAGRAGERGADLRSGITVTGWDVVVGGVEVRTSDGTLRAERLVLAAGAGTGQLAGPVEFPVRPERRVMHFFSPGAAAERFRPGTMPTFIWDLGSDPTDPPGGHGDSIYGFPAEGDEGVKVGFHNRGGLADPGPPQPPVTALEIEDMRAALAGRLPQLAGPHLGSVGCLYELTPDHHFLLGAVPGCDDRVVIAAGGSGHGFKFVPVIGEVVADLVTTGTTAFDLDFLSPARFSAQPPPAP